MVSIEAGWPRNAEVRLNYLASGTSAGDLTPVVFIPGAFGSAELYKGEIEFLAPRRCVAISMRGQGKSDAPRAGYRLSDYASDIASVVNHIGLSGFVLVAYSRGVPYAIRYCTANAQHLRGLILIDYPARLTKPTSEWAEHISGSLPPDVAKPHVLHALVHESQNVELWDELDGLSFPVQVLRGMQDGTLLNDLDVKLYRDHLADVEVVEFPDSAHELWKPSYGDFMAVIQGFLHKIDASPRLPAS